MCNVIIGIEIDGPLTDHLRTYEYIILHYYIHLYYTKEYGKSHNTACIKCIVMVEVVVGLMVVEMVVVVMKEVVVVVVVVVAMVVVVM